MYLKTCRCGKSQKNFKVDIGEFYVEECCIEAGYDELGNLKEQPKSIQVPELPIEVLIDAKTDRIHEEKPSRKKRKKNDGPQGS